MADETPMCAEECSVEITGTADDVDPLVVIDFIDCTLLIVSVAAVDCVDVFDDSDAEVDDTEAVAGGFLPAGELFVCTGFVGVGLSALLGGFCGGLLLSDGSLEFV